MPRQPPLLGSLPQLLELQLGVLVHAEPAAFTQVCAAAAAGQGQQELSGSPEQDLQLLASGLQQAGVQGLGGFRPTDDLIGISDTSHRTAFERPVGQCRFSGPLRVVW